MNISHPFEDVKEYFDNVLNKDKSSFKTSNDEPTPIGCIQEILDCIPREFWSKTDSRIIDPCCGNGNWHVVALDLMRKYQSTQRTDNDRLSQLHFNDTNSIRLDNVKKVFQGDIHRLNMEARDFLTMTPIVLYDMIYANPPYAKIMDDGKRASKNHTLIRDFLRKSIEMLNDGGYLVYLIPDNWMSSADRNDIPRILSQYQFLHLNIHGAKRWFPKIGSSFTWFILQKAPPTFPMQVHNSYNNLNLKEEADCIPCSYIPLIYNHVVQSILKKTVEAGVEKYKIETSSDLHKYTKRNLITTVLDNEHQHRLIHTPKQTVYATRPHKFQNGYKVFISTTDRYATFVDNCGMTQSIAFIRCNSEFEAAGIQKILMHPLYVFLNNICRWGNFNNIRVLQRFPIPRSADDVYGSFHIPKKEQQYIEDIMLRMKWVR